jgi:hypothetical protein
LRGNHFVPICLKSGDHLVKARAVGPDPVAEHDAMFSLRGCLLLEDRVRRWALAVLERFGLFCRFLSRQRRRKRGILDRGSDGTVL